MIVNPAARLIVACTSAVLVCISLPACTVVKINSGDTSTIEYEGGPEVGSDLANRACRKAGQARAEIVSTANKDSAAPPGEGKQTVTFKCVS